MSARSTQSVPARPRTSNPTSLLFQPSTAGWYAAWKARKDAAALVPAGEPQSTPAPEPAADAAEALARWLTAGR